MPQEIAAIAFDKPTRATEALTALGPVQANRDIDPDDAVVVTRDYRGKIQLHQTVDATPGKGAAWGGWFGLELARFKGEARILSTTLPDDVASEIEHALQHEPVHA